MRVRSSLVLLAILLVTSITAGAASANSPLLKVDFGREGDGPAVQPGFSELMGNISQSSADQTFGSYSVHLEGDGFYVAGTAGDVTASVRPLFRDYYYNNSPANGDGISLSIGGVTPSTAYDVKLWSFDADNFFSATDTEWSSFGTTTGTTGTVTNFATPRPTTLNDYSTTIHVTSTTSTLDIFGTTTSGGGGTRLNGFQLIGPGSVNLLSVDLGRPPGSAQPSPTQPIFAGMVGGPSEASKTQSIAGYNVTVAGQGFWNTGASADAITPSVQALYRDYFYNNSTTNGEGVTLTVANVKPNKDYDVTLWSFDADNFSSTPTLWSPIGATSGTTGTATNFQDPLPTALTDNRTTIRVHSTTNTLTIFGTTTGGTGGTRLNAVQLESVLTGDVNNDGIVDISDIQMIAANYLTVGFVGDANNDGFVDVSDIQSIAANWLQAGGNGQGASVPEPGSFALMFLGVAMAATGGARMRRAAGAKSAMTSAVIE